MNCDYLAATGFGMPAVLTLTVLCLTAGTVLLVAVRSRRRAVPRAIAAVLLLLLIISGGTAARSGIPAAHAAAGCGQTGSQPHNVSSPNTFVEVTQTSVLAGIAPGRAPMPITGVVINNGPEAAHIEAITVSIASVDKMSESQPGVCDESDFVLSAVEMPVGATLDPGESTEFTGATIGFNNKSVNQDACQRATIKLLYTIT